MLTYLYYTVHNFTQVAHRVTEGVSILKHLTNTLFLGNVLPGGALLRQRCALAKEHYSPHKPLQTKGSS